jgi:hypothetical protein
MTLLLLSCVFFRRDRQDAVEAALDAADALYAQRVEPERLDEAIGAYVLVLSESPGDGRVLWRLSRAFTSRAETAEGDDRRKELELARGYGLECLATNPGFAARLDLNGGRITRNAARQLTVADAPCLEHTLYSWVRWAEGRGAAAAVDLPALEALSGRAVELNTGWVAPWSAAMVILLRPGPVEQDLALSRERLQTAILVAPQRATAHADLVRWQVVREGDLDAFKAEVKGFAATWPEASDGEWAYENALARERVLGLQGRGKLLMYDAWSGGRPD